MTHTARLAGAAALLTVLLELVSIVLSLGREPYWDTLVYAVNMSLMGLAGFLIARAHPQNPIGWLLCAMAVFNALSDVAQGWMLRDYSGASLAEAYANSSWLFQAAAQTVAFVLFPSGRATHRVWRWVAGTSVTGAGLALLGFFLAPESGRYFSGGVNPYAVPGSHGNELYNAGMTMILVSFVAGVVSLVLRFRGANGVEREQLKWVVLAASVTAGVMPVVAVLWTTFPVVQVVAAVVLILLPLSMCAAILRYRLYDIDLVIKRTLVYASLTVSLVLVYLGLVLTLRAVPGSLIGDSDLAVAASTLVVAGLFRPLRRRIQAGVDRRFFRRAYDAGRTLDAFNDRLRQQVDLDSVTDDLRVVVAETLQPAHHSLWLRGDVR